MYVNYSTIVAQSLDYCSMIVEFFDKFKATFKMKNNKCNIMYEM